MKQFITAKLKLQIDVAQFQALRQTQLAYRDALNHVSRYSFEHGKMSNQIRLRDETYYEIRALYKGEEQYQGSQSRSDQETLQGPGQGSQVCFPHTDL